MSVDTVMSPETTTALTLARDYMAKPKQLLIGGKWMPSLAGETLESLDPATEEILCHIPAGGKEDVDAAVRAARNAFDSGPWALMSSRARGELLWKLADLIADNAEELAALETFDNGSPMAATRYMVKVGVETLRYYAGMATKIYGQSTDISSDFGEFHAYTRAEPVGVVGLITPWNAPLTVVCNKIAPALAAGCTCVIKPPEITSITVLRFGEIVQEAGFPDGVVNIVTGLGTTAGAAIAEHRDIDKISFTGSTAVGRSLVRAAAGNFKRLTLELGGKSPMIIMDDADLDAAIPGAAMAIFANSGQVCFAGSRLYVHKKVYDVVVKGVAEFSKALRLGNGFDGQTHLGPLVSQKQRERVLNYIALGLEEGGNVVTGGKACGDRGYFFEPTVLTNCKTDARVVCEEIFGPVVVAAPFDNIDELVNVANDTPYGLGAGVFTGDISTAHKIAKRLRAGNVWINCYGILDASMPFGGFRESGWGREFGPEGIDAFLEKKAVYAKL